MSLVNEWERFWAEITPGTLLLINSNTLCVMKDSQSHHTGNCLFNCNSGTIHHYSEYFLCENGIDAVKNCMVNRIKDFSEIEWFEVTKKVSEAKELVDKVEKTISSIRKEFQKLFPDVKVSF